MNLLESIALVVALLIGLLVLAEAYAACRAALNLWRAFAPPSRRRRAPQVTPDVTQMEPPVEPRASPRPAVEVVDLPPLSRPRPFDD